MAVAGTSTANGAGVTAKYAMIDHVHALGDHDHSAATKGGAIAMGLVGVMAAAGTSTANNAGAATSPAAIDHVHALGDHDHSGATKGGTIALAALAADFFTADATGRGKFQTGIFDAATLLDLIAADAFSNANCDAFFAANAFAADADSRAIFADGIWTAAKMAAGLLSADATGRALIAAAFFDAATCASVFDDNAIPSAKVNWGYGGDGLVHGIVPDDSAAGGTSAYVARIDHAHAITCGAPVDGSLAAANAEGSASYFARSDHAHRAVVLDGVEIEFGTGYDAVIGWETGDASNHTLVLGLADANQAIHIADKSAIGTDWDVIADTHPSVYIHSDTTPATDYLKLWHDGTDGFVDSEGGTLALAIAGTAVVTITATLVSLAATASIKFLGNTGLLDSNGNEVITVEAVADAINYLNVKNAATANAIVLECLGTADKGFIFANDQDEEILILTPVASAVNEITILNAITTARPVIRVSGEADIGIEIQNAAGEIMLATVSTSAPLNWVQISNADTGAKPIFLNPGEDDIGFEFHAKNAEEILILAATAAAVNEITITSNATGLAPSIAATGTNDNIDLSLVPKGTGYVRIDGPLDMSDNTLFGSQASGGDLLLSSTGHATKGAVSVLDGNEGFKVGGVAIRAGSACTNVVAIFNGTKPQAGQALVNGIELYSDGGELFVADAGGTQTQLSPHDKDGDWFLNSYSAKKGKTVRIHVEKMLKSIAEKFPGEYDKFIEELEGDQLKKK
jgi:hypothetical protein